MSQYMEMRFKAIVKAEFREMFEPIAKEGKWLESTDPVFRAFGEYERTDVCFRYSDINSSVKRWNNDKWNTFYYKETGLWFFHTEMNMRNDWLDIMDDLKNIIIPYCIEKVLWWEEWYEPMENSPKNDHTYVYEYINGKKTGIGTIDENGNFIQKSR